MGCSSITGLYLYNNGLTTLDLTKNPNLSWVNVNDNHIGALDLSKLTNLRLLFANGNELTGIDLSNAGLCIQLQLADNNLTSLDVTKLPSLYWLKADGNELTSLDLSANKSLSLLECGRNKLSTLDVNSNTALRRLAAEENRLTSLNVASNKDLCGVNLRGNAMEAAAINAIITQLPDVNGQEPVAGSEWISVLDISSMPGTAGADVAAAKAKGWRVTATSDSGIDDIILDDSDVVAVTYYTLSGMALGSEKPAAGCYIVRILLADGRTVTSKCFLK